MSDPTWRDFLAAYQRCRASRNWHPDLAGFYERRLAVYQDALGVDPRQSPEPEPTGEAGRVHRLLEEFADAGAKLSSPFAMYLEAPPAIAAIHRRHGPAINAAVEQQRRLYLDVMADCAAQLWGPCPRAVEPAELDRHGVGRRDEPDFTDYW